MLSKDGAHRQGDHVPRVSVPSGRTARSGRSWQRGGAGHRPARQAQARSDAGAVNDAAIREGARTACAAGTMARQVLKLIDVERCSCCARARAARGPSLTSRGSRRSIGNAPDLVSQRFCVPEHARRCRGFADSGGAAAARLLRALGAFGSCAARLARPAPSVVVRDPAASVELDVATVEQRVLEPTSPSLHSRLHPRDGEAEPGQPLPPGRRH